MAAHHTLTFGSYNSRGHAADRLGYIRKLMGSVHILFVQEHWYFESDMHHLSDNMVDVQMFGVSGMQQSKLLSGRPYGGCAIIFKKNSSLQLEQIATGSNRLCAALCHLSNGIKYLLLNAYMPCESRDRDFSEFSDVLLEIRSTIENFPNVNNVIIGGDMNTDFGRTGSSYADILREFCDDNDLYRCSDDHRCTVDYTYSNEFTRVRSTIDHFIISKNIESQLMSYVCKKDGDNLSDHDPVQLSLRVPTSISKSHSQFVFNSKRPAWHRATDRDKELYKGTLRDALSNVFFPREAIQCKQISCSEHSDMIAQYHNQLIQACIIAGRQSIPSVRKRPRKAGWEEFVSPSQQDAIQWNRLWVDSGKPNTGWLFDMRNSSRREYKRVSRWVVRNQDKLKADRMATALLDNRSRDFWSEVKRSKSKQSIVTSELDGVEGAANICGVFKDKYKDLYNSVSFDEEEMHTLTTRVSELSLSSCSAGNCYDDHVITVADVTKAMSKLKSGKSDALEGLFSDHFRAAPIELHVHIALLLTTMLIHGISPLDMLLSVLVPIPKNLKKSLQDSNNYRSIAISSLIGKILDNVILIRHHDKLSSSELQFGFKPGSSTSQCTFVLQEIISSYTERDSMVNCVLLDASKAFDRVQFVRLFYLLLDRGICPLISKLLLSMYLCQKMLVRWQGERSDSFSCSNGVKQGGVLSPVLFCLYMDSLLKELKQIGVGCHVGHAFAGALSYADDLTLIAPSLHAMRKMLGVCERFAQSYDVLFNSSKSVSLVFNGRGAGSGTLTLNGDEIPQKLNAVHLGHVIGKDSERINKQKTMNELYVQSNIIKTRFHYCNYEEKVRLFNSFCSSFYGSSLWRLDDLDDLTKCWRKCIRFLFNISNLTHSVYIPHLVKKIDLQFDLLSRFSNFVLSCVNSASKVVELCIYRSIYNFKSPVSDNIRFLISFLNVSENLLYITLQDTKNIRKIIAHKWFDQYVSEEIVNTTFTIIELMKMQNEELYSILSHEEINALLLNLCIS